MIVQEVDEMKESSEDDEVVDSQEQKDRYAEGDTATDGFYTPILTASIARAT